MEKANSTHLGRLRRKIGWDRDSSIWSRVFSSAWILSRLPVQLVLPSFVSLSDFVVVIVGIVFETSMVGLLENEDFVLADGDEDVWSVDDDVLFVFLVPIE